MEVNVDLIEIIKSLFKDEAFLATATTIGAILTAIGTVVTLWQASKVKKYGIQIAFDLRKIHISEIAEILKRAQDESRKLLTSVQQNNRGKNEIIITGVIQGYIDTSLNLLPLYGLDGDIRDQVTNMQTRLRSFQNADENNKSDCASELHTHIQDSVSLCKDRVNALKVGENNE